MKHGIFAAWLVGTGVTVIVGAVAKFLGLVDPLILIAANAAGLAAILLYLRWRGQDLSAERSFPARLATVAMILVLAVLGSTIGASSDGVLLSVAVVTPLFFAGYLLINRGALSPDWGGRSGHQ